MTALAVVRRRDIDVFTRFERLDQRRGHERHIAGDHQDLFGWRFHQRGVEPTKRAASGNPIIDDAYVLFRSMRSDNEQVRRERTKNPNLTGQDRAVTNLQRALVASAKPRPLTAREDGCSPHVSFCHD